MQFQFWQREQFRWSQKQSDKQRLNKTHCYLFAHFLFVRTQTSNARPPRPTNRDRQGQWWNTGHVFQDRSSAKAWIQLLECMFIVNIWSNCIILCSISFLSFHSNITQHQSVLSLSYCSHLFSSQLCWDLKTQAKLLCLSLPAPQYLMINSGG